MAIDIDIERLRKDLMNYYGTAMFSGSPMAMMEVSKVERAGEQELIRLAARAGFSLNKYQSAEKGNSAVEAWLRSMECKITDEDKAKLKQLGAEAKKQKADDVLTQTGAFVNDVRSLLRKFSETWQSTINGLQNQMAAKVYMSQDEVNRDMKAIIGSRDKFGKNYDELISQIDENGEKLLALGADYRSVKKIIDLIDETVKESRELDLDFGTTGATVMNIGSARFQISESSEKIRRKWQQRRLKEDRSNNIKMSALKSVSNEDKGLAEGSEKAKASIISEDKVGAQDITENDSKETKSKDEKERSRSKLEEFKINRKKEEDHVKEIIFSIITGDKKKTIAEMQEENQELRGMSVQRVTSYLRRFVSSGELECMENIYYMLPETAERIRTEEKKRQKRQEERRRQEEEKKNQEMEVRREYERVKDSLEQAKAGKERAEANIQKIQAEISELEADLERQNKKLFFKNKTYIKQLNATVSEKRARLKEHQEAREQCSQQLPELKEVVKSKYARFVQEDEENNRREFARKYPNISEFFRFESEKKKALIKQLISIMKRNAQKEWRIEELHDATGLPANDRFTIFRSLDNLAKDGLLEYRKINGSRLYKLCEKADVDALLNTL